jgi:trigger factor
MTVVVVVCLFLEERPTRCTYIRRITDKMSVQVEKLENNMAKLTIEVSADDLEKALEAAYQKEKNKISVPGFRKGKVPRAMIEKMYGAGIFYEDAANSLMQQNYPAAVDESGIDIVSRPTVDVVQIEKGKPFIFTAEVAVKPEVTLGKYLGVTVTKVDTTVTDEEVDAALEKERNNNARTVTVTDRPVQSGDTAVIDFEGFVDGVAFEGGKGDNYSLEIGSHSFIDTFEDQLIGKNAGDDVEVNVTFPEQYQSAELAGKPALFKVKIHEIKSKELPEINDEFASDVSEFETLAEYKESLKKNLQEKKETEAKKTKEDEAIQKIIDKSKMDIPDAMIETQCESMIDEFAQRISQSGLTMEQYFQFTGTNQEKLMEQVRPEALTRIQSSLVLEQIVKEENIEVADADIDAEIEKMASGYGMEADKLKEYMGEAGKESVKRDLAISKAVDLIMENTKERAKTKSKKDKDEEADDEE